MVEAIAFKARSQGRMDMVPWMGVAMLTGIGLNWLYERSKEFLKAKTISRKEKIEQTKEAEGPKTTA